MAAHNERNDRVARLVDTGFRTEEIREKVEDSPMVRLNMILRSCGLAVQVELTKAGRLDAIHEKGNRYPISQMSDGEKSALLLAVEVLMAEANSILIIDEPERHMHRSISAPLMEEVASRRPDCHFSVLTHDLDLAYSIVHEGTAAVVLNSCSWANSKAVAWDAELVLSDDQLPKEIRAAILGGKRRVLFIEGTPTSLDLKLLQLLLPQWPLRPIGNSTEVIRAVKGLRASAAYNWIDAVGVADNDQRTDRECDKLREDGFFHQAVLKSKIFTTPH